MGKFDNVSENVFLEKLKEDEFYRNYYINNNCSREELYKLGYFMSSYEGQKDVLNDYKLNLLSTYLFDKSLLKKDETNYVLLTSGGFSPFHDGHLMMIKKAKKALEQSGKYVLGGYVSPSHDAYVDEKRNGEAKMNIWKRIDIIEERIKDIEWLFVDKWEGTECRYDVNYTVVIDRLQKYLDSYYEGYKIEVVFIYGSDNCGFGEILNYNEKLSVCINRNNEYVHQDSKEYIVYYEKDNIVMSSEEIRNKSIFNEKDYNDVNGYYDIRMDAFESLSYLKDKIDAEKINQFSKKLICLFEESLSKNLKINKIDLNNQISTAHQILENNENKVLNLDMYLFNNKFENIGVSRVFRPCEGQIKALDLVSRKGQLSLKETFKNLNEGSYIIVDDDIASGFTVNTIKNNLPTGVNVTGFLGMNDLIRTYNEKVFDVVDVRDFIIGSTFGGLIALNHENNYMRIPYIKPYVNLLSRANIMPEKVNYFCNEVLILNLYLYKNSGIKLKELENLNKMLFILEGYNEDVLVEDMIIDKLKNYYV